MADNLSKKDRHKNMLAIQGKNTSIETKISSILWQKGYRFRRNVKDLKGKPDIAIKKYKIAIFLDSCFWHCCELHGTMPSSNPDYWLKKLNRNKERDLEINEYYFNNGWHLLRIWEHDIRNDLVNTVEKIIDFIDTSKNPLNIDLYE